MVVDLDHALGVVLSALSGVLGVSPSWVFKGGTCLRKAYFGDYRFSEDLDFTVTSRLRPDEVRSLIESAADRTAGEGVELLLAEMRIRITDDEYGRESIEVLAPYRGALRRSGDPRNIQFHLSADDELLLSAETRRLIHPYDDGSTVGGALVCYSPAEMLAEKLRAAGGQRRYAISRDVYDISHLVVRGADVSRALAILPAKAAAKDVDLAVASTRFVERREEYRADWERTLTHLVTDDTTFEAAFATTVGLLQRAETS